MGCFENRFSFEGFEGKHYGRMAIKMYRLRPLTLDRYRLRLFNLNHQLEHSVMQTPDEKPHAWRANIDDDYVDNCEQEKAMTLCQYAYVTSALPFVPKQFISKFFLGFFFALDRCQLLLGFGSVLIGSLGSDDKFCK
ncbi:hypothetical protein RIR_jg13213.t1 [Rhizophagus irregularis DAOM 181602=DAOM 197198]|nr:hypothetical protein RIR_jg13213.t1 [Rhizophagus irregularis DAOM 181602=DAOM 197198]